MVPPRLPRSSSHAGPRPAPDRPDRPARVVDVLPLEQRLYRRLDPVTSHVHVVVGEHDDPGLRRGHARVQRIRLSLAPFEQVAQRHRETARAGQDDVAGAVARVVVDHEDVPREPGIRGHRREAVERAGEVPGAVVGADQNSRVDLRRRCRGDGWSAGVRGHGVHAPGAMRATGVRPARESRNRWRTMPAKKQSHSSCSNASTRWPRTVSRSHPPSARNALR